MTGRLWQMQGAGNRFVLIDDRALSFPVQDAGGIRRTAAGSEGLILMQPSETADLRMRFFNPDGSAAEMCGNGARCFARLAYDLGAAGADMRIETDAGPVRAAVREKAVTLQVTDPVDWRFDIELGDGLRADFVNTGVPHAVLDADALEKVWDDPNEFRRVGRLIRMHASFMPAGTNVNFVRRSGTCLRLRTYERGVEDETGACGTGAVAAALIYARKQLVALPAQVECNGGVLVIDAELTPAGAQNVTLTGPAEYA